MGHSRWRIEAFFAALAGIVVGMGGGIALWVYTAVPVHPDAASVPSTAGALVQRYSAAIEEGRGLARALVAIENLPGLSVAVAADGELVWAEGFGWANIEGREPITPRTRFRLGAASKPLTAAAVALLHDRGRLDLDAPIQTYVTDYPQKQWPVTPRQLMSDVGGVVSLLTFPDLGVVVAVATNIGGTSVDPFAQKFAEVFVVRSGRTTSSAKSASR